MLKFDYSVLFKSPYETVSSLSSRLHYSDAKYILGVNMVCFEFDNDVLQKISDTLLPENSLLFKAIPELIIGMH